MVSEEKKSQYWNHFTDDAFKVFRPKKITDVRLKYIKKNVMDDNSFWEEIILRHQTPDKVPNDLSAMSLPEYQRTRAIFGQ